MTFIISPKNKITMRFFSIVITFVVFFLSTQSIANMLDVDKKSDVHLCPEVLGQLVIGGQPIVNQEVSRELAYGSEMFIDTAITDGNGYFIFPEMNIAAQKTSMLLEGEKIQQAIVITHKEQRYTLWHTQPVGLKSNRALSEKLNQLYCDLTTSEKESEFQSYEHPQGDYLVQSICRW